MPERLSIVAGSGALVTEIIAAARARGDAIQVFSLGAPPAALDATPLDLGDPHGFVAAVRAFGATQLTMAGAVHLDDAARVALAQFFGGGAGDGALGDGGLSQLAAKLNAMTGARLVGVHEIAPDLLAPRVRIGGPEPTEAQSSRAALALSLARKAGILDLGQALVVSGSRAIATEDISGTDGLIERIRHYRGMGLLGDTGPGDIVLAKAAKPTQPLFVDLPAIGPHTVERAAAAGIGVIAVQAGATVLIARQAVAAAADSLGVTVLGLAAADA